MGNKKTEVMLTGKWRLIRRFTVNSSEEQNLTLFRDRDYVIGFPSAGVLTENCDNEVTTTAYHYDPDTRAICIRQSERRQPSPISGAANSIFRVIPLNESEMYFQSPASIEDMSENFESILLERIDK